MTNKSKPIKRFYYTVGTIKTSKSYGGRTQRANVYRMGRQGLIWCGSVDWNTSSFRGAESTILEMLVVEGYLPKVEGYDAKYGYDTDYNQMGKYKVVFHQLRVAEYGDK